MYVSEPVLIALIIAAAFCFVVGRGLLPRIKIKSDEGEFTVSRNNEDDSAKDGRRLRWSK